jgi:hypothetical protein
MKNVEIETQSKIYIFDQQLNENENNFINLNNEIYKLQTLENDFSNKFSNILIKSEYYESKEKLYLYTECNYNKNNNYDKKIKNPLLIINFENNILEWTNETYDAYQKLSKIIELVHETIFSIKIYDEIEFKYIDFYSEFNSNYVENLYKAVRKDNILLNICVNEYLEKIKYQ